MQACKLEIQVPANGWVGPNSQPTAAIPNCGPNKTCTIDVRDLSLNVEFTAHPNQGFTFVSWKRGRGGFFCGGVTTPCLLDFPNKWSNWGSSTNPKEVNFFNALQAVLANDNRVFFLVPVFNQIPVVNAGADVEVPTGNIVTLTGNVNDDNTNLSYTWVQISGLPVNLTSTNGIETSFTSVGTPGSSSTFRLTVTDEHGAQGSDLVEVVIEDDSSQISVVADAGPDITVGENNVVVLTARGPNAADPLSTASFSWTQISGAPVSVSATASLPANHQITFVAPSGASVADIVFRLDVIDPASGNSDSDTVVITLFSDGAGGGLLVDAGTDQVASVADTVFLHGFWGGSGGGVTGIQWTQLGGPTVSLSSTSSLSPSFTVPPNAAGRTLSFRLTVTDSQGTASDTVAIAVVGAVTQVLAGDDIEVEVGGLVMLDGTYASSGNIVSTLWSQVSGPAITISSPSSLFAASFNVPSAPVGSVIVVRLTVTDDQGVETSDTIEITVIGSVTQVIAGEGQEAKPGDQVTLDGSYASSGNIVSTLWSQVSGPAITINSPGSLFAASFTVPSAPAGSVIVVKLTVIDDQGVETSDTVEITVLASPGANSSSLAPIIDFLLD
ncbi:MAG: hypothetical protein HOC23_05640 [Halieaceae bacterium]|nr:hypothetical protein [Halieaceae bacterium]